MAKKLYPVNMNKVAPDFDLVCDYCFNRMAEIPAGPEYDRLFALRERANELFCLRGPIARVDGKTYGEIKRMTALAREYRRAKCIEHGMDDYLQYC